MDGIKLVVGFAAIWVATIVGFGVIFKATYNVFMWGWNLL